MYDLVPSEMALLVKRLFAVRIAADERLHRWRCDRSVGLLVAVELVRLEQHALLKRHLTAVDVTRERGRVHVHERVPLETARRAECLRAHVARERHVVRVQLEVFAHVRRGVEEFLAFEALHRLLSIGAVHRLEVFGQVRFDVRADRNTNKYEGNMLLLSYSSVNI